MISAQMQTQIDDFSQDLLLLRDRLSKQGDIDTSLLKSRAEALYYATQELVSHAPAASTAVLKKRIKMLISDLDLIEKEVVERKKLMTETNQIKPNSLISAYQN